MGTNHFLGAISLLEPCSVLQPPRSEHCKQQPRAKAIARSKSHGKKLSLTARLICTHRQLLLGPALLSNTNPPEGLLRYTEAAGAQVPFVLCFRSTWLGSAMQTPAQRNTAFGLGVKTRRLARVRTWSACSQDMSHQDELPQAERNRTPAQNTLNGPLPERQAIALHLRLTKGRKYHARSQSTKESRW